MSRLLRAAIPLGVAIAVGISGLACAPAQAQGKPAASPRSGALSKEISEQAKIYQSHGDVVPTQYVIDRSLLAYTISLLPGFDRALAELGPAQQWLDIGAGEGQAILDYYEPRYDAMHKEGRERRGSKARAVGVSIEDRRTTEWHQAAAQLEPGKIRYLFGKTLSEYSPDELGKFDLATDVYGGFSYTPRLSRFMEKALSLLELNGVFYTLLIDVHPEIWPNSSARPHSEFQTAIVNPDGSELKVCAWLKRIACVEVQCEAESTWETPIERYRIRKICKDVAVPALESLHFVAGMPPARQFRLVKPSPAAPGTGSAAR